jgi:hypothetical protein
LSEVSSDIDKLLTKAAQEEKAGNPVTAAIYRIAASDRETMEHEPRRHRPNLGPYTETNTLHCVNCGKVITGKQGLDEECPAP